MSEDEAGAYSKELAQARSQLETLTSLGIQELLGLDRARMREALETVAAEILKGGDEVSKVVRGKTLTLRGAESAGRLVFIQMASVEGGYTAVSLPLVDWTENMPGEVILTSVFIPEKKSVHLGNNPDIAGMISDEKLADLALGVKWLASNLLNWETEEIVDLDDIQGHLS